MSQSPNPCSSLNVFISQFIRYGRACSSYECFILRAARLSSKLLGHYGRYGDLIKHYEFSLSQMLHYILGHDHIQWQPQSIRHYTDLWTYYRTGPYCRFWPYYQISGGVHGTLQRVRLANRGRLLLRTPGPVPFGTCICSNVETILSWTCHVYGPFEFRTSLGISVLLLKYYPVGSECFTWLLFMTKWCGMILTEGHIFKVSVTVHTQLESLSGSFLLSTVLKMDNI